MANDEIIEAEIISDDPKLVPYTVTGYSEKSPVRYQPQPVYQTAEPPTSFLAYLSVIFAVLAVPFAWTLLPAPLAVLTGYLALNRIADGTAGGYKVARFGMIAGLIEIGLAVLLFIVLGIFAVISWQTNPATTKLF